jgi:DNA-binding NarL/FixJ family response regulator
MAAALIRVGIVDDHPVVRQGIGALLDGQPDLEVVGGAGTIGEAAALLEEESVDVLLLDIRLGTESGLRFLDRAGKDASGTSGPGGPAVVVLSAYDYPQYSEAAFRLGAAGFVVKSAPLEELVGAIRHAAAGGFESGARRPRSRTRVSPRELDVVRLVVEGRSNDEIGAALGIGVKTVETHLRRLFERFELVSRTELAARAVREGWLDIPPT